MSDKKLTDNLANNSPILSNGLSDGEIIKALECCSSGSYGCENGCPLDKECDSPIKGGEKIMKSALDLINRLQAELKDLQKVVVEDYASEYDNKIKAEAYKECIEKVKEKSKKTEIVCSGASVTMSYAISNKNLDNLLKELVGEGDASLNNKNKI